MFFSPAFLLDFSVRHGLKPKGAAIDLQPLAQDAFTKHFAASVELLGPSLNADAALRRTKAEELLLYLHRRPPVSPPSSPPR